MGFLKLIAAACFAAGVLQGATITSGNVTFHWDSPSATEFGPIFSLSLDDGFSFSGTGNYDTAQHPPQCFLVPFDHCGFVPPSAAGLNNSYNGYYNPQFNGLLNFTFSTYGHLADGVDDQVFFIPFTATGYVSGPEVSNPYAPYLIEPCALPGAVNASKFSCTESMIGSGTALVRVGYVAGGLPGYFLKDAVLTFSEAPEPSTWLLMALPTLALLSWARRHSV